MLVSLLLEYKKKKKIIPIVCAVISFFEHLIIRDYWVISALTWRKESPNVCFWVFHGQRVSFHFPFVLRFLKNLLMTDFIKIFLAFFFLWRFDSIPGHDLPLRGFAITFIGHNTLGRTPLDEWSVRRRDLYLTTHNTRGKHWCLRRDSNPQS